MNWNPVKTDTLKPAVDQRVFYFFAPSGRWFVGVYNGDGFQGRYGFCDHHDAPYWHQEPPVPGEELDAN